MNFMRRPLSRLRPLRGDARGVAFLEFALVMPVFLGFTLGGIEFGNYVLANVKTQRMAAMASDLVAQSGTGAMGITEAQIYDLFSAIDVSSQPFSLRDHGRVVITAIQGTQATATSPVVNSIIWQRFDGGYTAAAPMLGCHTASQPAVLPRNRALMKDEIVFHVQVTLNYQPILGRNTLSMMDVPTSFTRVAMFRPRSATYTRPQASVGLPPKENCNSANGL